MLFVLNFVLYQLRTSEFDCSLHRLALSCERPGEVMNKICIVYLYVCKYLVNFYWFTNLPKKNLNRLAQTCTVLWNLVKSLIRCVSNMQIFWPLFIHSTMIIGNILFEQFAKQTYKDLHWLALNSERLGQVMHNICKVLVSIWSFLLIQQWLGNILLEQFAKKFLLIRALQSKTLVDIPVIERLTE